MDIAAPKPIRTSPLAIASLVFSLAICCCGLNGFLAVLLGVIALVRIGRRPDELTGRGLAITGIALGVLSILGTLAFVSFFFVRYGEVTPVAESATASIAAGDYESARGQFAEPLQNEPDFNETLVGMHNQFARLGTFEELESGWSVEVSGGLTTVAYTARFSEGSLRLTCTFREEGGEYRLTSYRFSI